MKNLLESNVRLLKIYVKIRQIFCLFTFSITILFTSETIRLFEKQDYKSSKAKYVIVYECYHVLSHMPYFLPFSPGRKIQLQ